MNLRSNCNESLRIDDTSVNSFLPNNTHAILDTIDPVWNLRKVLEAEFSLAFVESAVV